MAYSSQNCSVYAVTNTLLMTKTNVERNGSLGGGEGARRGGYLFPCCTGPSVSLNHSLLQHVQRDFGVGRRGSFPSFSATNITSTVGYSRSAVGVILQRSCCHVRLVTAHIFT